MNQGPGACIPDVRDAGADVRLDGATVDATTDVSAEAGIDVRTDVSVDAAAEPATDARVDMAVDSAPDVTADVAVDGRGGTGGSAPDARPDSADPSSGYISGGGIFCSFAYGRAAGGAPLCLLFLGLALLTAWIRRQ
jgi:hypothetical protein